MLQLIDNKYHLPALTSAHSHAFQRALRGRAQRPGEDRGADDGKRSWHAALSELATSLSPESIYQISRIAYEELRRGGVRTVGEFHCVHHQADGTPYEDRVELAEAVIGAARDEGLRICLSRVIHHQDRDDDVAEALHKRGADEALDQALRDVDELWKRYTDHPAVRIAIAPRSVRAVPPEWLGEIAAFARRRQMGVHMHLAMIDEEIEACKAETGKRPVELVADSGMLSERFVAVHASQLNAQEAKMLGEARAFVCLCPMSAHHFGVALPNVESLYAAGVRLCTGVDGHVLTSPLGELRAIELDERVRTGRRVVLRPKDRTPAEELWHIGSELGAAACCFDDCGGTVEIDRATSELMLVASEHLLDAIIFSGTDHVFAQSVDPA